MGGTVGTYRHARMGAANDDVDIIVACRNTDLVVGTMCGKHAIGAEHRNLAAQGHTRCHRHGVLLGDTHREESLGERILEEVHTHRSGNISPQANDTFVFLGRSQHAFAESLLGSFVSFV